MQAPSALPTLLALACLTPGCGDSEGGEPSPPAPDARVEDAHVVPGADLVFERHVLSDQFFAEGAAYADVDHDGALDVVSGPFVYRGPSFSEARRYRPGGTFEVDMYSDDFFAFVHDFDADGWDDVLSVAFPGQHATWYRNPEGRDGAWIAHRVFEEVDNESPTFDDLTGDGLPELICNHLGDLGYAAPDWSDPGAPWTFHVIAPGSMGKFTHGLGFGDVNGDGRNDVLLATGVWEQPADPGATWLAHPARLAAPDTGGAQMFVDDVDADGDGDVITTLAAHGYGVAWFEQTAPFTFTEHLISGSPDAPGPAGVALFEPHALTLADMDGDADLDIVTGERHWAHIPTDGRPFDAPAKLLWLERAGPAGAPSFFAHPIDDDSGVGTQVRAGDVDGDGRLDVVVANKKGAFVFLQRAP